MKRFVNYIKKSKESLITAASNSIGKMRLDRKIRKSRKQNLEQKWNYGIFKRRTDEITL